MGIADDLAPYMTLLRFKDASDLDECWIEKVYDNIQEPEPENGNPIPQPYNAENVTDGIFRRGSFDEASEVSSLTVYFEPIADGDNWRGVIRLSSGMLVRATDNVAITGEGEHEFIFDPPVTIEADVQYAFGVEPEVNTQQAKAYYLDLPTDGALPGDFSWQDKALLKKSNPGAAAWSNQVVVFGTWESNEIRRIDYETGQTTLWSYATTGPAGAWAVLTSGEVVGSDDATLLLLDPDDGSVLWSELLNAQVYDGAQTNDGSTLYLLLANGQVAVVALGATPVVTHYNVLASATLDDNGSYYRGSSVGISPDDQILVLHDYDAQDIVAYDVGDLNTPLWTHDYSSKGGSTYHRDLGISATGVYYSVSGTGGHLVRLSLESGIEEYAQDPSHGYYSYGLFADPNGEYLLYSDYQSALWKMLLDENGEPISETNIWNSGSEMGPAISDGNRIFVMEGDDYHRLTVLDMDGNVVWTTSEWVNTTNTFAHTARLALGTYNFTRYFTEVAADTPLSMRIVRRVNVNPVSVEGFFGGDRFWQKKGLTPFINEKVRALIPDMGVVSGVKSQVSAEAARDDEEAWSGLTPGKRLPFTTAAKFRVRLTIDPADYLVDFKDWPGTNNISQGDELVTASGNRLIVDIPTNYAGNTTTDEYGTAWTSPTSTSYDDDRYGLMCEGRDFDGDVEWVSDWYTGGIFMFRCLEGNANSHAYRLEFVNDDQVRLEDYGNNLLAATSSSTNQFVGRQRWRAIWRGGNFWLFRNGSLEMSSSGLVGAQDEDRNWFGFIAYASTSNRLYEIRGRGMANGNSPNGGSLGADKANVDFFSAFHERVAA